MDKNGKKLYINLVYPKGMYHDCGHKIKIHSTRIKKIYHLDDNGFWELYVKVRRLCCKNPEHGFVSMTEYGILPFALHAHHSCELMDRVISWMDLYEASYSETREHFIDNYGIPLSLETIWSWSKDFKICPREYYNLLNSLTAKRLRIIKEKENFIEDGTKKKPFNINMKYLIKSSSIVIKD